MSLEILTTVAVLYLWAVQ